MTILNGCATHDSGANGTTRFNLWQFFLKTLELPPIDCPEIQDQCNRHFCNLDRFFLRPELISKELPKARDGWNSLTRDKLSLQWVLRGEKMASEVLAAQKNKAHEIYVIGDALLKEFDARFGRAADAQRQCYVKFGAREIFPKSVDKYKMDSAAGWTHYFDFLHAFYDVGYEQLDNNRQQQWDEFTRSVLLGALSDGILSATSGYKKYKVCGFDTNTTQIELTKYILTLKDSNKLKVELRNRAGDGIRDRC